MAEEIGLEKCNFSELQKPRDLDLDFDLGSGQAAHRRASVIDLYLHTKFHLNRKHFLWTDVRTDGRTDVPTDGS